MLENFRVHTFSSSEVIPPPLIFPKKQITTHKKHEYHIRKINAPFDFQTPPPNNKNNRDNNIQILIVN